MARREGSKGSSPRLPKPSISLRLDCAELDVNFAMLLPMNGVDRVPYHRILQALASVGLFGSGYDLEKAEELQRFQATLQQQDNVRRERHQFYKEVEKNSESLTQTMQTMKRDYYREIDHLREQLTRKARDPKFEPDNVFFFDVGAYKLPSWDDVTDKLDGLRMQRELLLKEFGGSENVKNVPMHMLCPSCRDKFKDLEDQGLDFNCNRCVQTEPSEISNDAVVQTDGDSFLFANSRKGVSADGEDSCMGSTRLGEGELSDEALEAWNASMRTDRSVVDDEHSSQDSNDRLVSVNGRKSSQRSMQSDTQGNLCGMNQDGMNQSSMRSAGVDGTDSRDIASRNGPHRKSRKDGLGENMEDRPSSGGRSDAERNRHGKGNKHGRSSNDKDAQDGSLAEGDENSIGNRGRVLTAEEKAQRMQAILEKAFGGDQALKRQAYAFGKLKDNWSARQEESIRKHYQRQSLARNPEIEVDQTILDGSLKRPRPSLCLESLAIPEGHHVDTIATERLGMETEGQNSDDRPRRPASSGGEMSTRHRQELQEEEEEGDIGSRRFSVFASGGGVVQLSIGLPSPTGVRRGDRRCMASSCGSSLSKKAPHQQSNPLLEMRSAVQNRSVSVNRGTEILSPDRRPASKHGLSQSASAGSLSLPSIDLRSKPYGSSNNSSSRSRKDVFSSSVPSSMSRHMPRSAGFNGSEVGALVGHHIAHGGSRSHL